METDYLNLFFWLINSILVGVLFGCASSFVLLTLANVGLLEWYDINKKRWMPQRCEFCAGFWSSVSMYLLFHHFELWPSIIVGSIVNVIVVGIIFGALNR